ncbi:unnamed protein product [Amoebophrya sp. A120]|nr:unnamed protein product [Amoebophrya sp. A120]|eukprot:GSA120T00006244001.1
MRVVLCIGDSHTRGVIGGSYVSELQTLVETSCPSSSTSASQKEIKLVRRGVDGQTVSSVRQRIQGAVTENRPEVVILLAGTNDCLARLSFEKNNQPLLSHLMKVNHSTLLSSTTAVGFVEEYRQCLEQCLAAGDHVPAAVGQESTFLSGRETNHDDEVDARRQRAPDPENSESSKPPSSFLKEIVCVGLPPLGEDPESYSNAVVSEYNRAIQRAVFAVEAGRKNKTVKISFLPVQELLLEKEHAETLEGRGSTPAPNVQPDEQREAPASTSRHQSPSSGSTGCTNRTLLQEEQAAGQAEEKDKNAGKNTTHSGGDGVAESFCSSSWLLHNLKKCCRSSLFFSFGFPLQRQSSPAYDPLKKQTLLVLDMVIGNLLCYADRLFSSKFMLTRLRCPPNFFTYRWCGCRFLCDRIHFNNVGAAMLAEKLHEKL